MTELQPLHSLVGSAPCGVISFVGGGGKTSLMFHLARLLADSGKRVLTTTTTKILFPTPDHSTTVLIDSDPEILLRQALPYLQINNHITCVARNLENGKLQGFAPEVIGVFHESKLFDWILVEADGAARRPLKAPAGHEPVIPPEACLLIAVAGLDVLGERLSEELVFRSELAGKLMNLSVGEIITEADLARLLAHPCGSFKDAPPAARRLVFLNKADSPERRERAAQVAEQLRHISPSVAEALIVGQALDKISVHAVHPLAAAGMSRLPKVTGIILAAGTGSRMGRTKQLLPFRGKTLLECVVDSALASSLHRVIVVLGHQAEIVAPLLKERDVTIVNNPCYAGGQSSSLKAGLHAVTKESDAVLFLLGDQPLVTPEIIDRILASHAAFPSPVVFPVFAGKRGNPVLFSRETFACINSLTGDCGARSLFDRYAGRILGVPVDDPAIHFDIDTEEDFRTLLRGEEEQAQG